MSIKNVLLAASVLALAVPAMADNNQPQQKADDAAAKKRDNSADRIICRSQEEIGSRLRKKKICMTAAEWRDASFRAGQTTERREAQVTKQGGG